MSALGHKRTYAVQKGMSALPPIADTGGALAYVCFVPGADIARSLNHRVGAPKYCRRNGKAECLCGFKIDRQFVLVRRLHWRTARPGAP